MIFETILGSQAQELRPILSFSRAAESTVFSNGTTREVLLVSIANVAQNKENVRQELLRWSDYSATISRSLDSVLAQVEGKLTFF